MSFCCVEAMWCVGEDVAAVVVECARRDLAVAGWVIEWEHVDVLGCGSWWWVVRRVSV